MRMDAMVLLGVQVVKNATNKPALVKLMKKKRYAKVVTYVKVIAVRKEADVLRIENLR
jgi:hypothetical protein